MNRACIAPTIVLAAYVLAACAEGGAPTGVPAGTPSFGMSWAEEQQLKPQEEAEKERIKQEQERSKATYDSLKLEWERLNRTYPDGNPSLIYCEPLQYVATVKIVGPEGADLNFGPHKLSIPRGALTRYTVITAEAPVSFRVEATFSPHGLVFQRQPKLTLSYKHCNRPTSLEESVAYIDEGQNILEWPRSSDYTTYELVYAWLDHFSNYAVAYRSGTAR